jgi:sortase (surface protein transpeptidase)
MKAMTVHSRRGTLCAAAGVALAVIGVIAVILGVRAQRHAPQPPASAAIPIAVGPPSTSRHPGAGLPSKVTTRGPILGGSAPVQLAIPAIGVTSSVHPLGLNADKTVQVPPLGSDSYAGWYKYSPAPGQLGPSIILGHIDSARYGPGVFFKLGALRQRDRVFVTRADHSVAVFEIERVVEYPKAHFPTLEVYGNTDHAALRLITCGGKFDLSAHSYEDNIVVYASLISSHRN